MAYSGSSIMWRTFAVLVSFFWPSIVFAIIYVILLISFGGSHSDQSSLSGSFFLPTLVLYKFCPWLLFIPAVTTLVALFARFDGILNESPSGVGDTNDA